MTPKREKYLNTCSQQEARIRGLLKYHKHKLKEAKAVCNAYNLQANDRKVFSYLLATGHILHHKTIVSNLRHELNRLKGMDRVVVPRDVTFDSFVKGYCQEGFGLVGVCSCGKHLVRYKHNYCPDCGCRILWNKVL